MQKIRKEVRMVEITCVYEKLVEQLVVNPKAMCDVYNSSLSKYFEEPYCEVDYWNFIDFVHEHFVKYLGEGIGHPGTTPVSRRYQAGTGTGTNKKFKRQFPTPRKLFEKRGLLKH